MATSMHSLLPCPNAATRTHIVSMPARVLAQKRAEGGPLDAGAASSSPSVATPPGGCLALPCLSHQSVTSKAPR